MEMFKFFLIMISIPVGIALLTHIFTYNPYEDWFK